MTDSKMPNKGNVKGVEGKAKGVDDLTNMNAFLAMIGGTPVPKTHFERPAAVVKSQLTVERAEPEQTASKESLITKVQLMGEHGKSHQQASSNNSLATKGQLTAEYAEPFQQQQTAPNNSSQSSSDDDTAPSATPPTGVNAPPTTPATAAVSAAKLKTLSINPIDENESLILAKLADPNSSLADSKYAPKRRVLTPYPNMPTPSKGQETGSLVRLRLDYPNAYVQTGDVMDHISERDSSATSSSTRSKIVSPWGKFEDNIIAKYMAKKNKENVKVADDTAAFEKNAGVFEVKNTEPFPDFVDDSDDYAIKSPPKPCIPADAQEFIPSSRTGFQSPGKEETKGQAVAGLNNNAQSILNAARLNVPRKEPGSPEEAPAIIFTNSEDPADRENATHFTGWGTPEARTNAPAKGRKVVLRGLPVSADLTFVQSLIYGGAIDTFVLGINGSASVTFATADACDDYCAKYPNGMQFRYKGKSYVVYVDKGQGVDVVSGMLRGHLECGASRCVRATGADEDWGMKALIKLAEGRTRVGKVEHIGDVWRNQIRTIIFRFTSITDAVTFKAMLVRNDDWEECDIQFFEDPCEKATGLHLE